LGRVLATQDEEVVVDRLFAGNVQLIKALQPLVEAAETTLQSGEARGGLGGCNASRGYSALGGCNASRLLGILHSVR